MLTYDAHSITEFHQIVVKTTKLLITAAESDLNIKDFKQYIKSGLETLIKSTFIRYPRDMITYTRACAYRNQYNLRVRLIQMMVKHESCHMEYAILNAATDIVQLYEQMTDMPGTIEIYKEMMDSLGEMFRQFVLVRPEKMTARLGVKMKQKEYIKFFIAIAGHSSQPGRSKNMCYIKSEDYNRVVVY